MLLNLLKRNSIEIREIEIYIPEWIPSNAGWADTDF